MIRFEHVHLEYEPGNSALDDIDLTIHLGEFVVLYGPSGSGKSSLLKLLHRQRVPSSGRVFVVDQDLASLERSALPILRRGVAFLPAAPKLLPNLTVLENVALPIKLAGEPNKVAQRRALSALSDLKLDDIAQSLPASLPPATLQLCCLARCLVTAPSILLADDPTASLDPTMSKRLLRALRDAHLRGMTVLLATTNPNDMDSNYQRILVLREGSIASDTPATRFRSLHLPTHADAQLAIPVSKPSKDGSEEDTREEPELSSPSEEEPDTAPVEEPKPKKKKKKKVDWKRLRSASNESEIEPDSSDDPSPEEPEGKAKEAPQDDQDERAKEAADSKPKADSREETEPTEDTPSDPSPTKPDTDPSSSSDVESAAAPKSKRSKKKRKKSTKPKPNPS